MYKRRALRGAWMGVPLGSRLRVAMISNQADTRWLFLWNALLDASGDDFLGGSWVDGFRGVLLLPIGHDGPDRDILGSALQKCARRLEGDRVERRPRFAELLKSVKITYPGPAWDVEFITIGDKSNWPNWTISALPRVVVRTATQTVMPVCMKTSLANHYPCQDGGSYFGGLLYGVRAPQEALDIVNRFDAGLRLELEARDARAMRSESSWTGAFADTIAETAASPDTPKIPRQVLTEAFAGFDERLRPAILAA
jgi:hypothetical protein